MPIEALKPQASDSPNTPAHNIFDRLKLVEERALTTSTTLKVAFTTGLLCWGLTSYLIVDKLTSINTMMSEVKGLSTATSLLTYRQDSTDRVLSQVSNTLKEQGTKLDALNNRITSLTATIRISEKNNQESP